MATIVHRPWDARIAHRQLRALDRAGWEITYAAPFTATEEQPAPWYDGVDLPRAVGRKRLGAIRAARRMLKDRGQFVDVILLHDPELLLAVAGLRIAPVVLDVHEDPAAAIGDRSWIPRMARPIIRRAIWALERWAEHRCATLLLAEHEYQRRFRGRHPVVPNVPIVPEETPEPGTDRVVYLGRISRSRGAAELVELGRRLHGEVTVQLIGYVDADAESLVHDAHERGWIDWLGYLPNDEALQAVRGAAFGLSLLHDQPNYRHSMPTKVIEYMAHGVPVISTPLPVAVDLLARHDLGTVVPFGDVDAVEAAVRLGVANPTELAERGRRSHAAAQRERTWTVEGPRFVDVLATAAG